MRVLPIGRQRRIAYCPGGSTVAIRFPFRSNHASGAIGASAPIRRASTPVSDAANAAELVFVSLSTRSAVGTASPVGIARRQSNPRAISVPWRVNNRYPGSTS